MTRSFFKWVVCNVYWYISRVLEDNQVIISLIGFSCLFSAAKLPDPFPQRSSIGAISNRYNFWDNLTRFIKIFFCLFQCCQITWSFSPKKLLGSYLASLQLSRKPRRNLHPFHSWCSSSGRNLFVPTMWRCHFSFHST